MPPVLTPVANESRDPLITPVRVVKFIKNALVFPAFSYDAALFADVLTSYVAVEFSIDTTEITESFVLKLPVIQPPSANFCIAVRIPNGTAWPTRRKLYGGVGENLVYPLYAGETITNDSVFEIWTADDSPVLLSTPYYLLTSYRSADETDCCCTSDNVSNADALNEVCEIWTDDLSLPLVFDTCDSVYGKNVIASPATTTLAAAFSGTPLSGEAPLVVAFTDASTGGVLTWNWYFGFTGVGNTSTAQNPIVTFPSNTTYDIMLTVSDGLGNDTLIKSSYVVATNLITTVAEFEAMSPTVAEFEANSETVTEFESGALTDAEIKDFV